MPGKPVDRRTVLRGAALAGSAGLGVAACSPGADSRPAATPTAPVELGAADEIGEGGVKLYRDANIVVSRSTEGTYKAFSSVCTHARCPLT